MKPRNEGDSIDELIDTVIAESLSGKPRVTGESIRAAALARKRSWLPVWAAVAAILVIGFVIGRRSNEAVGPVRTAGAPPRPSVESSPAADPNGPPSESPSMPGVARTARTSPTETEKNGEPYAGLPRLDIAPIEAPNPLTTSAIDAATLIIPRIEITPLPTLSQADGSGGQN